MELECRLCSSKDYLLSMFGGKSKKYRHYLRKIIYITIGIRIEEHDKISKCICMTCAIKAFNFYTFQILSLENEIELKSVAKVTKKLEKSEELALDMIKLPNIKDMSMGLQKWIERKKRDCLLSKHTKVVDDMNSSPVKNNIIKADELGLKSCLKEKIDKESQTEITEYKDKWSQIDIKKCDVVLQTDITYHAYQYNQNEGQVKVVDAISETTDSAYIASDSDVSSKANVEKVKDFTTGLKISVAEENNYLFSETISPKSSPSLILTKEKHILVCRICNKVLNDKMQYKRHLKIHMKCCFCNKRFRNITQIENHQCEHKISFSRVPSISLVKAEYVPELKQKYPHILHNKSHRNNRRLRMRSKSLSSLEKLHGDSDNGMHIFFLKKVVSGVSKTIQTLPFYDKAQINDVLSIRKKKFE